MAPVTHKPNKITIHCSASKNGVKWDISEIRKEHLSRGFSDVGYHVVIQPDGEMQPGRPLNQPGAHVEGHNTNNLGICLIGTDKFTGAQFKALESVLDVYFMNYPIESWELWGHYLFDTAIKQGKTCPNIPIQVIMSWYHLKEDKAIAPYLLKPEIKTPQF